jgi:lipopolysaccharide export system protein LptA
MSTAHSHHPSVDRKILWAARAAAGTLALALALPAPAVAKQSDREQPVQVDAGHFDGMQQPNSVSHLRGNVVITQGSLKATGDSADVHFDANSEVSRVLLKGGPAHLQQEDDNGNLMSASAATIDYQIAKDQAILSGDAHVKQQGRGEARGDTLVYNTRTSHMTGDSSGDSRVHLIFQSKQKPAPADEGN